MNERRAEIAEQDLPEDGEVAYFVHLHLDTATKEGHHPGNPVIHVYRVEGKARPMLVLQRLTRCRGGKRLFLVLPITSTGHDSRGNLRQDVQPIGNCIDIEKQDFVKLDLYQLPENLLHRKDGGQPVVKPCDPLSFSNAVKVILHKVLRLGAGEGIGPLVTPSRIERK